MITIVGSQTKQKIWNKTLKVGNVNITCIFKDGWIIAGWYRSHTVSTIWFSNQIGRKGPTAKVNRKWTYNTWVQYSHASNLQTHNTNTVYRMNKAEFSCNRLMPSVDTIQKVLLLCRSQTLVSIDTYMLLWVNQCDLDVGRRLVSPKLDWGKNCYPVPISE